MAKDWDKYISAALTEKDAEARIEERNRWIDENALKFGPGSVVSYKETANGDHVRSDGTLLSTRESRAKEDVPQWKKFELGRLEDVDGFVVPGPNALPKDVKQYGGNVAKTGRAKKPVYHPRDVDTGDFITVGPLHEHNDDIVMRVDITYPLDLNELIGRCFIADDSHVSMRVQEAAGSSDQVTVTNSPSLHFIIPKRAELKDATRVKLAFYFRKKHTQIYRTPDWDCTRNMPQKKGAKMTERTKDWDTITGWEKRIKVDFGSIGADHVRWSHWTHKERDIVARKVHESRLISQDHGPRSKRMEEWAKENAPIMIDFARDHKPMPDWAHADYRESGIPGHVQVVWKREDPSDMASPAGWAYDPPHPWEKGEEPAWSARPKEPDHDPDVDAANRYRNAVGLPPVEKSQSEKLHDALTEINQRPDVSVKRFNPQSEQFEDIAATAVELPKKIMPDDPKYTHMEKALCYAAETHHGKAHQNRWNRVAATMGADNGHDSYSYDECEHWWNHHGQNKRWSMVMGWWDDEDPKAVAFREEEMRRYHSPLTMQGHYTLEDWQRTHTGAPRICKYEGYDELTIYDPAAQAPNWWLDGDGVPTELWRLEGDNHVFVKSLVDDMPVVDMPTDDDIKQTAAALAETDDVSVIESVLMKLFTKLGFTNG